jgi:dienelactone hydrolase
VPAASAQKDSKTETEENSRKGTSHDLESLLGESFRTQEQNPVKYSATYYFGNADKDTAPVLVLHNKAGNRADFKPLAELLSQQGYAVLAPDLRGHGKSAKRYDLTPEKPDPKKPKPPVNDSGMIMMDPRTGQPRIDPRTGQPLMIPQPRPALANAAPTGKLVDYKADDFSADDFKLMYGADLTLLRNVLKYFHNKEDANMNRLVIVGYGSVGGSLGAFQVLNDWKTRTTSFTKTFVWIAPANPDASTNLAKAFLKSPLALKQKDGVSILFVVPENNAESKTLAEEIHKSLFDKNKDPKAKDRFMILTYTPIEKQEGNLAAVLSGDVGKQIFNFINEHNQELPEKEVKWKKIK